MLAGGIISKLQYVDQNRIAVSLLLYRAGPSFFVAAVGIHIKIITHEVAAVGDLTSEGVFLAYFDLIVLYWLLIDNLLTLRRFVVIQYFLYFLRVSPD